MMPKDGEKFEHALQLTVENYLQVAESVNSLFKQGSRRGIPVDEVV